MATLALQVGASSDDASQSGSGSMFLTGSYVPIGNYYGLIGAIRFTGASGLSGSTINTATLTFIARADDIGTFQADWYAEDNETPLTFASASNDITNRTLTTTSTESDGADYGNWVNTTEYTFDGSLSDTNTLAEVIQELADDYDPGEIVLINILTSGLGERLFASYDFNVASAAKLDIDYTAATGDFTATPDPVAVPIALPVPSIAAGPVTATPDPVALLVQVPIPSAVIGGITATPDPVVVPIVVPTPQAIVTATPDPITIPIVIPIPGVVAPGADITVTPDPVVIGLAVPAPTVVIGGVTATPDPVTVPIAVPTPQVNVTATPSPVAIPLVVLAPSVTIGGVTATPDPVAIPIVIPLPSILGGGEQFVPWGIWDGDAQTWLGIEQFADPADFAPGSVFRLHVGMYTSAVGAPIKAYLYNVTDGLKVVGSDITGTAIVYEVLRSGTFNLDSGLKKYRLEFGGNSGGVFYSHGGKVLAESS